MNNLSTLKSRRLRSKHKTQIVLCIGAHYDRISAIRRYCVLNCDMFGSLMEYGKFQIGSIERTAIRTVQETAVT